MQPGPELMTEARRQLSVCNACRYCEGYCATFLALERRPALTDGDISLIANICHDCRGCFQACMFTPPHQFAIEIPQLLSAVRAETYRTYAWPRRAAALFGLSGRASLGGALVGLVFLTVVALLAGEPSRLLKADPEAGSFYRIIPFEVMVGAAAMAALGALALWVRGSILFARDAGIGLRSLADPRELVAVAREAVTLRWMKGGGDGCYYPQPQRTSESRRLLHAMVVVGFIAANVSTSLAALSQHMLGLEPPLPVDSPPVLFGILGGILMVAGTTGLIYLKGRSATGLIAKEMLRMDWAFLIVFDLVSITGFLTLFFRETPLMSAMLLLHLAALAALVVTVPYGKFTHVLYRLLALFQTRRDLVEESSGKAR